MTDLALDRARTGVVDAAALASSAAEAAGVDIRHLESMSDLAEVRRLFDSVWHITDSSTPVTADMLRAMAKAGSYVSGAYDGEQLVGACFGFFSPPAMRTFHSHIAAVAPQVRRRNVGFAMKLHQRAWALSHGMEQITWTYDPALRRNAYFNLGKLAAEATEYLPDFYGAMGDGVNHTDASDRILVRWHLHAPAVEAACVHRPPAVDAARLRAEGAATALEVAADGGPRFGDIDSRVVLIAVPEDIVGLRRSDPALASAWRVAVRETLGRLMADGGRVCGFDRTGVYIIDRMGTA